MRGKNGGFSIIETVIAMSLIGAGLIGLFSAYQRMSLDYMVADQSLIALNLARETLEKIIAQRDCNNPGCGYQATLNAINTSNDFDENPVSGFSNFSINTTAIEVDPDQDPGVDDFLDSQPGSGYARVNVQVSFNNGANRVRLYTLITDYPSL